MGLGVAESYVFLREKKNLGLSFKKVAMIGRQFLYHDKKQFEHICTKLKLQADGHVFGHQYGEDFFHWLGAELVHSFDYSKYEKASYVWDMSQPIPNEHKGQYDLVFDGGSLEHIFDVKIAIQNQMEMLCEGGWIISCGPMNNWCGHGFYQLSPDFFFRVFCKENGFGNVHLFAIEMLAGDSYRISKIIDPSQIGSRVEFWGKPRVEYFCLAQKKNNVSKLFSVPVVQSDYSVQYLGSNPNAGIHSFKARMRKFLEGFKIGRRIVYSRDMMNMRKNKTKLFIYQETLRA